ncbi:TPA: hypothetical protein EYO12_00055 [Candidatus Saccharibacteria bacterium]|nr:hypothetical protein [Candidatus Saccharibacteria bacterium]HIO87189.1 hypothetical protein [Candidatus Saccharibacteria bacterium]
MLKIDDSLLQTAGLADLPDEEKKKLLAQFREMLEMRVGVRLAQNMTDDQLDEFEGFIDTNDQPGALKWLETNFPNYKQVVAEEFEGLKKEITENAEAIRSTVA